MKKKESYGECPICGSFEFHENESIFDGDRYCDRLECTKCGTTWVDVCVYADYYLVQQGIDCSMGIKLECSTAELNIIKKIADRALSLSYIGQDQLMDTEMSLEVVHCNGRPLLFQKLLNLPSEKFRYDVLTIINCVDRNTGGFPEKIKLYCDVTP